MNLFVRPAVPSDLVDLLKLVHSAYRGDEARRGWTHEADLLEGQRTDLAALEDVVADPRQAILLAIQDGALVGCVQIADQGGRLSYLGLLSVTPDRQAGGLGKSLLAAAEQAAAARFAARRIEMTVIRQRTELIEYYERRGYALTGEERPFPLDDERLGLPRTRELAFAVLAKNLERISPGAP